MCLLLTDEGMGVPDAEVKVTPLLRPRSPLSKLGATSMCKTPATGSEEQAHAVSARSQTPPCTVW